MDSTICGLNKVICRALNDSDNGKSVSITNGINTWTATVADKVAAFLIPSIPVPARKTYTVSFGEFSRDIQMGYGDIIDVVLADGYEAIVGADLLTLNQMNAEGANLKYKGVEATGVKAIYDTLETRTKAGNIEFKFGVLPDGRYGYKKAGADTVTPFRTGQETLCYYMGQGRSFSAVSACKEIHDTYGIDLDYTKLTNSNFVLSPVYGTNKAGSYEYPHAVEAWWEVTSTFTAASPNYNSGTGVLNVSGGTAEANFKASGEAGSASRYTSVSLNCKAYLIVSMN